ncbi:alcohol dehydrogenase GroES-like domain-containing protein [Sarocladium implicatum]|nr:alcohol dehydrogenase GroES-like domain-containing protein [Sarocladium implicatum]
MLPKAVVAYFHSKFFGRKKMTQIPEKQNGLLLHGVRQPYQLTADHAVPQIQSDRELLVKTAVIGLNPIDWKAPDFNFGIPCLPYVAGREVVGQVVRGAKLATRFREGDWVLVIATDYRDLRKAGFQEYVVVSDFNAVRIPPNVLARPAATLGVAYVAAALSLGICMGIDFSDVLGGPNLKEILQSVPSETLPADIRDECLAGIPAHERAVPGDWIAIWGGSSTSANLSVQLARLAGLRVVTVVDSLRHGLRLSNHETLRPDLLVDSHDPKRASAVIRANLGTSLRFALDTVGRDSATSLLEALTGSASSTKTTDKELDAGNRDETARQTPPPSPPETPRERRSSEAHLVGLTGLPKGSAPDGVNYHAVPIKVFHEVPAVGEAMTTWLERLLESGKLVPPEVLAVEKGFEGVNRGLDQMRRGEIRGGRMVVDLT